MARIELTGLPAPQIEYCAVCVAFAKGAMFADEQVRERAKAALEDDGQEVVFIGPPAGFRPRLQESVTMAPSPNVGGGIPVPLCWTHAPLIDGSAPAPPPDQPPPPIYRGRGGGLN